MHTFVGFIHFCTCAYLMTELGLKMGYGMLFFSTHKNRKPATRRPYTTTEVLTYHGQLQYYAQHIVHNILVQQR